MANHLLRGVVGTTRSLAAQHDALHEFLLGNIHVDHQIHLEAHLVEHLIEGFGLRDGAGKAVEDISIVAAVLAHIPLYNINNQLVGNQATLGDALLHALAEFRLAADLRADYFARRDVVDPVVLLQFCGLGSFATARGTK